MGLQQFASNITRLFRHQPDAVVAGDERPGPPAVTITFFIVFSLRALQRPVGAISGHTHRDS